VRRASPRRAVRAASLTLASASARDVRSSSFRGRSLVVGAQDVKNHQLLRAKQHALDLMKESGQH
jgi:hypothetical protein